MTRARQGAVKNTIALGPHRQLGAAGKLDGARRGHLKDVGVAHIRIFGLDRLEHFHRRSETGVCAMLNFRLVHDRGDGTTGCR